MTTRTFATWVEPIAARILRTRSEIIELARSLPADAWLRSSPNSGWTYHDLLAHIADDTGKNLHDALLAVADGRDIPAQLFEDIDARNARGVASRLDQSVEELLTEIERDGGNLQSLLKDIREEDETKTQPELRTTFGRFLRDGLAAHDEQHLQQLRTATDVERATMTTRAFAPWVEPHAKQYRENRATAVALARSLTADQLTRPTGNTGWSVREELVHIVGSDADFIRTLGAVIRGETVDMSIFADIDGRNARNLDARTDLPITNVADGLEANGNVLQDLLAQLTADDESRQPEGFPFPLSGLINGYGMHEPYHIGQIQAAVG